MSRLYINLGGYGYDEYDCDYWYELILEYGNKTAILAEFSPESSFHEKEDKDKFISICKYMGLIISEDTFYWDEQEIQISEEYAKELYELVPKLKADKFSFGGPDYTIPTYREEWVDENGTKHFKVHTIKISP